MKHYKNIDTFTKHIQNAPAWGDIFTMGGKLYRMVEYGDGHDYEYVIFQNKKTGDTITVHYDVPTYNYIDGKKVQTKVYRFIDIDSWTQEYIYPLA